MEASSMIRVGFNVIPLSNVASITDLGDAVRVYLIQAPPNCPTICETRDAGEIEAVRSWMNEQVVGFGLRRSESRQAPSVALDVLANALKPCEYLVGGGVDEIGAVRIMAARCATIDRVLPDWGGSDLEQVLRTLKAKADATDVRNAGASERAGGKGK